MKKAHWIVPVIFLPLLLWAAPEVAPVNNSAVQFQSLLTHSRLVLPVDDSVPAELKKTRQGFDLVLKGVGLSDLGAPLGAENSWGADFNKLNDSRVEHLNIREIPGGVQISGKWKFPQGKLALSDPNMEVFDFREKESGKYIIDFWVKEGPTILRVKSEQHRKRVLASVKKEQDEENLRVRTKLEKINLRRESIEKSKRYCHEPLAESNDIFLRFYPVHQQLDFSRWFPSSGADLDYIYSKPKKKSKDAQYANLATELYSQGNMALALKVTDFLNAEFPHSEWHNEMEFLRANAHLKLKMEDEAEKEFVQLMEEEKNSPIGLHSATFLARRYYDKNLPLAAMEKFLWLIAHFSDDSLNWVFHMGVAECLYSVKQTDKAAKEYRWVMENGVDAKARVEAAARIGDLYLARFQYEQALGIYSQSYEYFGDLLKKFPTFYVNQGEVLYQLHQYDKAKDIFGKFLEFFPGHQEGWRATFRLGEIAARTSQSGLATEEARKWFYGTINNYPSSTGSVLARIRLLPCGDHGEFGLESEERFFSHEAHSIATNPVAGTEVTMPNYEDFRALSRIRALIDLAPDDQTASVAMQDIHTVKSDFLKKTLTQIANEYFRKTILGLLKSGKKFEALAFYSEKAPLMPNPTELVSSDYVLQLSRVASDFGLGKVAQEIEGNYRHAEELKHKGERQEGGRMPASQTEIGSQNEHLSGGSGSVSDGKTDEWDVGARLEASEQKFTEARALWAYLKDLPVALLTTEARLKRIQKVRTLLEPILDESPFSYEKEIILGLLDQKQNKLQSALNHALRAQLLSKSKRVDAWLATLEVQVGDLNVGLDVYQGLEKKMLSQMAQQKASNAATVRMSKVEDFLGLPNLPSFENILLAQADILERQGRWGAAASVYSRVLEKDQERTQVIYQYARSLIKKGGESDYDQARELLLRIINAPPKLVHIKVDPDSPSESSQEKPGENPDLTQAGGKQEATAKPGEKKIDGKPEGKADGKTDGKPEDQSGVKLVGNLLGKLSGKIPTKVPTKVPMTPGAKPSTEPGPTSGDLKAVKREAITGGNISGKAEAKADAKSGVQLESKPGVEAKPGAKSDVKADPKAPEADNSQGAKSGDPAKDQTGDGTKEVVKDLVVKDLTEEFWKKLAFETLSNMPRRAKNE